jgi:hypothetical protein
MVRMKLQTRWLWQCLFWSGYGALSLFLVGQYVKPTSGIVMIMVLVTVGLFAASEAVRKVVLTRGWLDLAGWPLMWRILLFVPFCATLLQVLIFVVVRVTVTFGWVTMPPGGGDYRLGAAVGYVVNTSIMLWLWSAAWITWQYVQRYRQGEVAKWRAEAAQAKLELDVLKAQVNPHFMFNALNNLRAMINEDKDKARDMVTRLSNILRHTLYHSRRDRVAVAEELGVVRDYIALEQLHYEDNLRVEWHVEEGVQDATLPPMLLQLLVENAVKHGIAKTVGGGSIGISLRNEQQDGARRLCIRVTNPGSWESVAQGSGPQHGAQEPVAESASGLGLNNLRERLARVSGKGAVCRIEAVNGKVEVNVEIPR